jgi:glycosyltransferase involved in cell wall biosynthesis
MSRSLKPLPRLIYVADVPVEASYHGSVLIYRLLQTYPVENLLLVEQAFQRSIPSRRLPSVRYEVLSTVGGRLLTTRFNKGAASWLTLSAAFQNLRIRKLVREFEPQAVLTVLHGFSWLTAAALAKRYRLPLHVIVHDDWIQMAHLVSPVKKWMQRRFGQVYRESASRLCVSPSMIVEYRRRYGIEGTLLYPSRGTGTPYFETSADPRGNKRRPFTIAYAGSLNVGDYVRQLVVLSWILPRVGGRLLLFGPFDKINLASQGMNMDVVAHGGLVNSTELILRLRREADVLFVPESFKASRGTKLSFPSKLADYTAAAMPLLIWGPLDSAAVKWAADDPGTAAVVADQSEQLMIDMVEKLAADENWREVLGTAAGRAGKIYFSPERARSIFYEALYLPDCSRSDKEKLSH